MRTRTLKPRAPHPPTTSSVEPDLVGSSKFFFDKYSTFYMFYLGAHQILGGTPSGNNQVQGYDCVSTGTQQMPPSWTDTTDPNVDFDTKGRVYQTMLPFNSFFDATKLHPDGEIDVSYSDDMGRHWVKGNSGVPLEPPNNASAKQLGHVEDKQWVAVNHIAGNAFQDHVYAAWAVFNGNGGGIKVRMAVSRDRGQTFAKAVTMTAPSEAGPGATYVYPAVDGAGHVYVSVVSFPANGDRSTIYVARSTDDARTFTPFVPIATVSLAPGEVLPNTRFRTGIIENFTASPTYPGHLYLTYEDWDPTGGQMDVKFAQSTDAGATWTTPVAVNDNVDTAAMATDQFQPSVAAGPSGALAVAFYDRRQACPNDPSVVPADVGRMNFCIDTSLQAYKDNGAGAVPVGANVRISTFTWDPDSPPSTLAVSPSTRAPEPPIPAQRAVVSSATTSASPSRRATSTPSWCRRTTPPTWPLTRLDPSTTNSRCSPRCRASASAPTTDAQQQSLDSARRLSDVAQPYSGAGHHPLPRPPKLILDRRVAAPL